MNETGLIPLTVGGVLSRELLATRLILAVALLAAWPLALWAGTNVANSTETFLVTIVVTGLLFGSAAYVALFLPLYWVAQALLALIVVAVAPVLATFRAGLARGLAVWAVHAVIVVVVAVVGWAAVEGPAAAIEFPAAARFARAHDRVPNAGRYYRPVHPAPVETTIRWQSTGSAWLDRKAGKAAIEVSCPSPPATLKVELRDDTGTLHYERVPAVPYQFRVPAPDGIIPDHPYDLIIHGDEGTEADITIWGVLPPALSE